MQSVGAGVLTKHPPLEPGPEGNYHLILKGNYHLTLTLKAILHIIIVVVVVRRSRRRDVKRNGDLGCSP